MVSTIILLLSNFIFYPSFSAFSFTLASCQVLLLHPPTFQLRADSCPTVFPIFLGFYLSSRFLSILLNSLNQS
ncbi:hypothetical protein DFH27DRAFT_332669 [Peziza echinospora]|nr:hypothetical protein DFH27DRAFT_332669 [Peziza echinospora]